MPKFIKKPVEIEAVRIPHMGEMNEFEDRLIVLQFMENNGLPKLHGDKPEDLIGQNSGYWIEEVTGDLMIRTLEGDMRADDGDWLIKGIKGEFYPCKPDIFEASYDFSSL